MLTGSGLLFLAPGHLFRLLLLLQHRPFFGDLHVVDRYVYFVHAQAGEVLHAVYNVAPDGVGEPWYGLAVLYGHRQVYGGLFFADLDGYAFGEVPTSTAATAGDAARHTLQEAADGRGGAAAHLDLLDLLGRDAGDLGDHGVAHRGGAHVALEGASLAASFAHALVLSDLFVPHT